MVHRRELEVSTTQEQTAPLIERDGRVLLDVIGLTRTFPRGFRRKERVHALDGVSFSIRKGETVGLVGESGCGKSTLARALLRLIDPDGGRALFRSEVLGRVVDLASLDPKSLRRVRRELQMVFQDPTSSLNPHMTVEEILSEPFVVQERGLSRLERARRVAGLMQSVGLSPEYRKRHPRQFSGGQRQRIGIARALALKPKLIVADEPVSALDVSVQGQVLNLLADLQKAYGLTYLFIAHDLSVVSYISDRAAVMYMGKIVEFAPSDQLYRAPKHPYTEALLSAAPIPDPRIRRKRIVLRGGPPSPVNPPPGCRFHPRCPYAALRRRKERCSTETPPLRRIGKERWVACHFAEELGLRGIGEVIR